MRIETRIETWALSAPLRVYGYTFTILEVIVVRASESGAQGHGEALGVYYHNATAAARALSFQIPQRKFA